LTPEEARSGVVVPLEVPALVVCSGCQGSGGDAFAFCFRCRGEGTVDGASTLRLQIPPLAGDETWMIPSVGSGLDLRIRIRVDRFT
jgi:DnaJ-class molecular chaperone